MNKLSLTDYLARLTIFSKKCRQKKANLLLPDMNVFDLVALASRAEYGKRSIDLSFYTTGHDLKIDVDCNTNSPDYEFSLAQISTPAESIALDNQGKKKIILTECRIEKRRSHNVGKALDMLYMHIEPEEELTERERTLIDNLYSIRLNIERCRFEEYAEIFK